MAVNESPKATKAAPKPKIHLIADDGADDSADACADSKPNAELQGEEAIPDMPEDGANTADDDSKGSQNEDRVGCHCSFLYKMFFFQSP